MRLHARAVLVAAVLALVPTAVANAEDDIVPLDGSVTALAESITPLESGIEPLETISRDGSTIGITLQSDILFPTGSSELPEAAQERIGELIAEIPADADVAVDGHTDSVPYARGNQVLSEERADAVARAIAAQRPDLHLTVTGYGDTRKVAAEEDDGKDDPAARAENRRVEIRYDG